MKANLAMKGTENENSDSDRTTHFRDVGPRGSRGFLRWLHGRLQKRARQSGARAQLPALPLNARPNRFPLGDHGRCAGSKPMKTDADVLRDYCELVSHVLWQIATSEQPRQARESAERLFYDGPWKGKVVGTFLAKRLKPQADREAIYGAMLDLGFELPSLLEPSTSPTSGAPD
jgi:hypothetical protein